ncbi:amino acid permease/ SLC12A domain-containing protein [Annulohypoxylon maeteangense]|uniref:amino acid permease/ SLC12A domain-containing protein n=1 Tax=Annulohypoxylon maeteangense TaxID=1927788 RepID=UPI002007ED06|nr:amino acid permease/ SLC12A domain-containing protein [Annulohypoxylon maeteangense]KAI0880625.1 amino acid permease/ SLC12A domain-containing protein [Annulohypoxylon maeteangense]
MDSSSSAVAADGSLHKVITTRQFVLMALSSSIGAGVLLATYSSLAVGGPGSLLISFIILGFAVWITMCALGELSVAFPVNGSFYEYSVRFISPAWGFAMGWNYVINFLFIVVFELVVMLLCVRYWDTTTPAYCFLLPFIGGLILVNAFGAKWYAEAENVFAVCKMAVLSTFIIVAILIVSKAIPADTRPAEELGFNLWKHDAFKNGPGGFLYVFMAAGMAYGGTEMLGITAAECERPQKVMRLACTIVPVRIVWLYLLPIFMLGLVLEIPLNEHTQSGGISPFVAALDQARLPVLAGVLNGIIIVAVFSMANASVFASSRALQAISARGMGPAILAKIKWGHPIWALVVALFISFLSLVKMARNGDKVFDWLLALAAGSNYFTWISICVCHIRLRLAIRRRGLQEDDILRWKSPPGIVGSAMAIFIFAFGLVAQIVAAIRSPLPKPPHILASLLGIIVVFIFWLGYMVVKRSVLLIPLDQIDLKIKAEEGGSVANLHDVESGAESIGASSTGEMVNAHG